MSSTSTDSGQWGAITNKIYIYCYIMSVEQNMINRAHYLFSHYTEYESIKQKIQNSEKWLYLLYATYKK